jgi:hypothetical protein
MHRDPRIARATISPLRKPEAHPARAQARQGLSFASYRREQTVTSFMFFIRVERHRGAASASPRTSAATPLIPVQWQNGLPVTVDLAQYAAKPAIWPKKQA